MSFELWIGVIVAALGTYLIRLLPLLWMQRRLRRSGSGSHLAAMPQWLIVLGPMMIAAMLGVSLVPKAPGTTGWVATVLGLAATLLGWRCTRSLGLPVMVGAATFGAVVIAIRSLT